MDAIRPYQEKDRERVRQICLKNADCAYAPEETKEYILLMFCDYYIEQEPENCFVAVDANDNAVGYIICAENYEKYAERGWLTPEERASWCDMHDKYSAMGFNGLIDTYRRKLDELDDKEI